MSNFCETAQMTKAKRPLHDRILEAEERASRYLADGNEASERGNHDKAERLWEKGQFWLDRYNRLAGNN